MLTQNCTNEKRNAIFLYMITLRKETTDALNIEKFTDIQQQVIPHAINHEDIYALAPTGSGKTYAYVLPVLEQIELQGKGKHFPRCIIFAPTRELSIQITHVIRDLLKNREGIRTSLLTGGYDIQKQIQASRNGADIVVGTPSRIKDHLRRHTLKTKMCDMVVVDEADMMLSMGFEEDLLDCLNYLKEHQTMLFSATETNETKALAKTILRDPFLTTIKEETEKKQNITVHLLQTKETSKIDVLTRLLNKEKNQCILFCNKRKTCDFLTELLKKRNYSCDTIHSDMNYQTRKKIMESFRNHDLQILCATDVASRGIDIPSVDTVILYDISDTEEQLIHRVGRCSRDGRKANAYLLITKNDHRYSYDNLFKKVIKENHH